MVANLELSRSRLKQPGQLFNAARRTVAVVAFSGALSGAAVPAMAGALDGKTYILEMTSSQYDSGYANYLVPPMARALKKAGLTPKAPGADLVINIKTDNDVGQWMGVGAKRQWLYTNRLTIGISPADYVIPLDGTPRFGAEVTLVTPNGDRDDELVCQIELAVAAAVKNYRPNGLVKIDGKGCLRKGSD